MTEYMEIRIKLARANQYRHVKLSRSKVPQYMRYYYLKNRDKILADVKRRNELKRLEKIINERFGKEQNLRGNKRGNQKHNQEDDRK